MDLKRHKRTFRVPRINVLEVEVDDISQKNAVSVILKLAKDTKGGKYVVTVNAEFVMLAQKNSDFLKILNNADLTVADGQGIVWSKLILGGKEHDRITGVDLLEKLCAESAKKTISVGFLGGFGDVAERLADRQKSKFSALSVVFAGPGDPAIGYDLKLKNQFLRIGRVDILFVAYGMGQQEFWIARNLKRLNVGVFIGVGGAFDYLSMVKKRAPKVLQIIGLEWLWRLFWQPSRIWRMRVLPVFTILVIWQIILQKLHFFKNRGN